LIPSGQGETESLILDWRKSTELLCLLKNSLL